MAKAQPDADALGRPRAELVGPVTITAMYGAAVYVDRRASRAREHAALLAVATYCTAKDLSR
jgi:hypothetical protein